MYRVLSSSVAVAALLAATIPANSSSILRLLEINPDDAPSVIRLGDAEMPVMEARAPGGHSASGQPDRRVELLVLSESILAVGPDAIPVGPEKVASVDNETERPKPRWIAQALPTIIRGGVQHDAGARQEPASPAPRETAADAAPTPATTSPR